MDLKEIGRVGANCINMIQYRNKWRAVVNTVMNFGSEFIARNLLSEELTVYQGGSSCIKPDSCLYFSCKFLFSISLFEQLSMYAVLLEGTTYTTLYDLSMTPRAAEVRFSTVRLTKHVNMD